MENIYVIIVVTYVYNSLSPPPFVFAKFISLFADGDLDDADYEILQEILRKKDILLEEIQVGNFGIHFLASYKEQQTMFFLFKFNIQPVAF